jgi:hypothetical protein
VLSQSVKIYIFSLHWLSRVAIGQPCIVTTAATYGCGHRATCLFVSAFHWGLHFIISSFFRSLVGINWFAIVFPASITIWLWRRWSIDSIFWIGILLFISIIITCTFLAWRLWCTVRRCFLRILISISRHYLFKSRLNSLQKLLLFSNNHTWTANSHPSNQLLCIVKLSFSQHHITTNKCSRPS